MSRGAFVCQVVIHRHDLARLAPLWLKYTEDIRRDREGPNKWPIEWNDNRYTVNRIEWVAEMFGYVVAASHLGHTPTQPHTHTTLHMHSTLCLQRWCTKTCSMKLL